jgi:hypothetical protein
MRRQRGKQGNPLLMPDTMTYTEEGELCLVEGTVEMGL